MVRPRWSSRRVNLAVNYGPAQPGGGWRLSAGTPPPLFPTTVDPDQVGPPRAEPSLPVVSSPSYPPHPPSNNSKFERAGVPPFPPAVVVGNVPVDGQLANLAAKVQGLETELAEVRREVTQMNSRLDALFDLIRTGIFDDTSSDGSFER